MPRKRSAHPRDEDFRGDQQQEPRMMQAEQETATANQTTKAGAKIMPVIDMSSWEDFNNVPELKILPAGSTVKVKLMEVVPTVAGTSKADMIRLRLDIVGEPLAREVSHPLTLPSPGNKSKVTEKQWYYTQVGWKRFLDAFEVHGAQLDLSDLPGRETWVILGVQSDKSGQYGDQNVISRWLGNNASVKPSVTDDEEIPFQIAAEVAARSCVVEVEGGDLTLPSYSYLHL